MTEIEIAGDGRVRAGVDPWYWLAGKFQGVVIDNSGRKVSACFHHHRTHETAAKCARRMLRKRLAGTPV